MKRLGKFFFVAAVTFIACYGAAYAEINPFIKAEPVSFLISPDIDGFSTNDGYWSETLSGGASWLPMVMGGLEMTKDKFVYSAAGGVGYLYNEAFRSTALSVEAAVRYKFFDFLEIGPNLKMIYFTSPSWEGVSNIDLDSSVGFGGGVSAAVKIFDNFNVVATLDYIGGKFDVTAPSGVYVSDTELDYSGFMFQLGVKYTF